MGDLPDRNVRHPFPFFQTSMLTRLTVCLSVCVCLLVYAILNIACAGLSFLDLIVSEVWERLYSQPAKEALSPL